MLICFEWFESTLISAESQILRRQNSIYTPLVSTLPFGIFFTTISSSGRSSIFDWPFLPSTRSSVHQFWCVDFCYPSLYLCSHLRMCFKVLFGVLASLDKHSTHSFGVTQRPSPGSHDQHNVLPLAPSPPRFTLLPLSSHSSAGTGSQPADHHQTKVRKEHFTCFCFVFLTVCYIV